MATGLYELRENDQIFFLHIPKTGGMTLKTFLRRQVGGRRFRQIPIRKFNEVDSTGLQSYRCIRAHWDYGFFRVLGRKPIYITMLRHPVARMLSMYAMIQRKPASRWYTNDIHLFIDRLSAERLQAHFLAGTFQGQPLSQTALLEVALTRLAECAFYGITEQFPESLTLLCATFGWRRPETVQRRNVAVPESKPSVDQDVIAHIEEACQADMELYNAALKNFVSLTSRVTL